MSKSKNIGTAAESLVVNVAQLHGFSYASRVPLSGALDKGDVILDQRFPVIFEIKAGEQCRKPGPALMKKWFEETKTERINARAVLGVLILKPPGYGPATAIGMPAYLDSYEWAALVGRHDSLGWMGVPGHTSWRQTTFGDILTCLLPVYQNQIPPSIPNFGQ